MTETTSTEPIAKALDLLEEAITRIEGEWGMGASIESLRAEGDDEVAMLDSARLALELRRNLDDESAVLTDMDRIAAEVNRHAWFPTGMRCLCGERVDDATAAVKHQASVIIRLTAIRLLAEVTKLPAKEDGARLFLNIADVRRMLRMLP